LWCCNPPPLLLLLALLLPKFDRNDAVRKAGAGKYIDGPFALWWMEKIGFIRRWS